MRLRPGLRPGPRWGAYSAHPDSLAGFGGKEWGREGTGMGKKRKGEA